MDSEGPFPGLEREGHTPWREVRGPGLVILGSPGPSPASEVEQACLPWSFLCFFLSWDAHVPAGVSRDPADSAVVG